MKGHKGEFKILIICVLDRHACGFCMKMKFKMRPRQFMRENKAYQR